jgi:hypothetical protein
MLAVGHLLRGFILDHKTATWQELQGQKLAVKKSGSQNLTTNPFCRVASQFFAKGAFFGAHHQ